MSPLPPEQLANQWESLYLKVREDNKTLLRLNYEVTRKCSVMAAALNQARAALNSSGSDELYHEAIKAIQHALDYDGKL